MHGFAVPRAHSARLGQGRGWRAVARGSAMLAVVAVTGVVAIVLMSLLYQLSAEQASSHTTGRSQQAWTTAMAGVYYAASVVASDPYDPTVWSDDEGLFRQQLVADDGVDRWYFSVFMPSADAGSPWRYGVSDEAGRLHLNEVTAEMLALLPGMDPTRGEAVMAYLETGMIGGGAGDDADERGDEAFWGDTASSEDEPPSQTVVGGGPVSPTTVEELLVVPAISAAVLYGQTSHAARRSVRRDGENDVFDADPSARVGARHWLTVWSQDPGLTADGDAMTAMDASLESLASAGLPPEAVDYVEAHREHAGAINHPAELVDAELEYEDDGQTVTIASGISAADLPMVLERIGPASSVSRVGRVNVNTAPAAVLARLEGLDEERAEQIVLARERLDPQARQTIGWLVSEQVMDVATFQTVAPRLTARCAQIRMQVVGYAVPSGAYRVLEAVVDLSADRPRIRYLRDQTQWGLPFALAGDDLPGTAP